MAIPIYTEEVEEVPQQIDQNNNNSHEEIEESPEDFIAQFAKEITQIYTRFFGRADTRRRRRNNNERRASSSTVSTTSTNNNIRPDLLCCHNLPPNNDRLVVPADVDTDPSGIGLDIKMAIDISYRRIGRDLRSIADSYQEHNSSRHQSPQQSSRRRHPAGSQLSIRVHVVLPLTLVAFCTLAYIKKS